MSKFEIFKSTHDLYYFRLKASNGEVILKSEGYKNFDNCANSVNIVKSISSSDKNYEIIPSINRGYYFILKSSNGEILGKSEIYTTKQGCENGKRSVMKNARIAYIDDLNYIKYALKKNEITLDKKGNYSIIDIRKILEDLNQ